jgi:predicted outer membrane repeat protein
MSTSPRPSAPAVRPGRRLPALLLLLLALFSLTSSAFAATLTVTNANDGGAGSLRSALAAAGSGDTIIFDAGTFPAGHGTAIALTSGRLTITHNLTIQGPGAGGVTISDSSDSVFNVTGTSSAPITVSISGLTIANGNGASTTSNGNGGAIYGFAANLTVTGCTLSHNTANGGGGGISSNGGSLTLTNCILSGNSAGVGGGINSNGGSLTLTGCTLIGNTGAANGGGISSSGSTVTLTNCTFSGNTAGNGGGIYVPRNSVLSLTNCTLVANIASGSQGSPGAGGGIYSGNGGTGVVTVQSCLINGNNGGEGPDVFGSFGSNGSNLIGDPNGAAYGFTGPHDLIDVDPRLDPNGLGSNGGPTPTVAVLAGSPAIGGDYNNDTPTDQRGIARTTPQHTIGAFEYKTSHTHLLWTNADGRVSLWNVNADGSHADFLYGPYVEGPGSAWSAKDLAEGPDGVLHILWINTDKRASLWNVNADGSHSTLGTYGPYVESAGSVWSATALSVGPDNLMHLLWNNTDMRASLWNVDASGNFVTVGTYGPYVEGPGSTWFAKDLSVGPNDDLHLLWGNTDTRASLWNVGGDGGHVTLGTYGPFTDGSPDTPWNVTAIATGP